MGPKKQHFWQKINILKETIVIWEYGERQFVKNWAWFYKQSGSKIEVRRKRIFYKKWSPKLIFLNEFSIWKSSVDFWHRKLTLKVPFRHFLMNHNSSQDFLNSFLWECWFLGKKLAFYDPPSLKFHNRTDTKSY